MDYPRYVHHPIYLDYGSYGWIMTGLHGFESILWCSWIHGLAQGLTEVIPVNEFDLQLSVINMGDIF